MVACGGILTRKGFELIEELAESNNGFIVVLDQHESSPSSELVPDILAIVHILACGIYRWRKHNQKIKKAQDLPQCRTEDKN